MRSFLFSKSEGRLTYYGPWSGLGGSSEVDLEDIASITGQGLFSITPQSYTSITGGSAVALVENVDFKYGKRLDASTTEDVSNGFGTVAGGIIDTGISSALDNGRAFRIVDNSSGTPLNIKNVSGLNIQAYAEDLSILQAPAGKWVNIDPIRGSFILPRPICSAIASSPANMQTPAICDAIPSWSTGGSPAPIGGKQDSGRIEYWGGMEGVDDTYCFYINAGAGLSGNFSYFPNVTQINSRKGSYYSRLLLITDAANTQANITICLYSDDTHTTELFRFWVCYHEANANYYVQLYINGVCYVSQVGGYTNWERCFIVWDADGGLTGGKTIRIFEDTTEIMSSTIHFPASTAANIGVSCWASNWGTRIWCGIGNVKIWNHVITEDPTWFQQASYAADSIHPIYSATNNYKPKLLALGGVGYKYITVSTAPATLNMPSSAVNVQVPLEDISDYVNGVGYFGSAHHIYSALYESLIVNTDYYYDEALDGTGTHTIDIYDDGVASSFASGKIMRIVNAIGGTIKNISDPTGLNLKPIAKSMLTNNFSPPATQVYIDPARGKILLPRPLFWSKCESISNMVNPEIGPSTTVKLNSLSGSGNLVTTGKFGNGLGFTTGITHGSICALGGILLSGVNLNQCTLSFWSYCNSYWGNGGWYTNSGVSLILGGMSFGAEGSSDYNATCYCNTPFADSPHDLSGSAFNHFYILLDSTGSLRSNTMKMRVFLNGVERLYTNTAFDFSSVNVEFSMSANNYTNTRSGNVQVDNIKIWDHIVSEDPSFEYNGGSGRENALHNIYGATNNYKPKLISLGGVGYYKASGASSLLRGVI